MAHIADDVDIFPEWLQRLKNLGKLELVAVLLGVHLYIVAP
jgi:hypothetical protein